MKASGALVGAVWGMVVATKWNVPLSIVFQMINVNVIIIYFCGKFLLSISYCAKYSNVDANNSLTFSLEILKDINCVAYALKVLFNFM